MAAFSYQNQSLHLDSVLNLQQSSQMRMSGGLFEDPNITTSTISYFPQFYQSESDVLESDCFLDQSIKVTLSNNEPALTNKTCTDSSSVTDKNDSGEQVTQKVPAAAMEKKRKTKEGPPVNSADHQSKGLRDHARGNSKKQKKCRKIMKDDEEKKPKEDEKDRKKAAVEAPTVYIHVRARRGQATDSHSLAERVRREKISDRMKVLEALVPGCDKVTGKALMLDEIINYVQSLQHQVEFLSMKIASLNPMFYDFAMDLDSFMASPDQTLSNMASPTQNMQKSEPMQPSIISERNNNALRIAANNYSQLDSSASVLFQQHLNIPQILSQPDQANGQLLWDVDDQRQKLINQTGFTTNLCSFH